MTLIDKSFTSFEVAKVCGVLNTTVAHWISKGTLKARTAEGRSARVALGDLVDFMTRLEISVPEDIGRRAKRILIVEDDPAVQRLLSRTLETLPDVSIASCAGGLEAMMAIGKEVPDLLILDVRLPQLNGLEICKLLRANEQTQPVKIVAITGESIPAETEAALKSMADVFWPKPLATSDLKSKVSELLELKETVSAA
jgi:CheY-like chemotaxis protein